MGSPRQPSRPAAADAGAGRGGAVREPLLEPLDPVGEDLQRTAGVAPAEPDERDLEHEPRIRGVGAAHVDDRLPERLEAAHQQRVAEHLADRAQSLLLVLGRVDVHLAASRGEEERVAQRAQQVLGDAAGVVARLEQRRERR